MTSLNSAVKSVSSVTSVAQVSGSFVVSLESGRSYSIGRAEGNNIRLVSDNRVSRNHASVSEVNGRWTLSVLSSNGVKINDQMVCKGQTVRLPQGIVEILFPTPVTFLVPVDSEPEIPQTMIQSRALTREAFLAKKREILARKKESAFYGILDIRDSTSRTVVEGDDFVASLLAGWEMMQDDQEGFSGIYGKDFEFLSCTGDGITFKGSRRGVLKFIEYVGPIVDLMSMELDQSLEAGVGIHFGETIPSHALNTNMGSPMNFVSRVESSTKLIEEYSQVKVLVSQEVKEILGDEISVKSTLNTQLKGFEGTHTLYQVEV